MFHSTEKTYPNMLKDDVLYPCYIQEGLDTDLIKLPTTLTGISCQDNLLILC